MSETPLAEIRSSVLRRGTAVGALFALGSVLLVLMMTRSQSSMFGSVALLCMGLGLLWLGLALWQATKVSILLMRDGIHDDQGTLLCPLDNIRRIDNGVFSIKPSQGFSLQLEQPMATRWQPGLWWRFGRRLGIGGSVAGSQTKAFSKILAETLEARRHEPDDV